MNRHQLRIKALAEILKRADIRGVLTVLVTAVHATASGTKFHSAPVKHRIDSSATKPSANHISLQPRISKKLKGVHLNQPPRCFSSSRLHLESQTPAHGYTKQESQGRYFFSLDFL